MAGKHIGTAVDYLNSFYPVVLIPDQLFKRAGCEGKLSSIERNLRRAQKVGKVKVEYLPNEAGTDMIAHYQGVPGWIPNHVAIPKREKEKIPAGVQGKERRADHFPPVYFYELAPYEGNYSPYYTSMEALEKAMPAEGGHRYTGSHEKPIRISGGPNPK